MIDNIILYALGIFLMAGMSGWGRPVIIVLITRAVYDTVKGMGSYQAVIDEDALEFLADISGGDARSALNAVELGILTTERSADGKIHITLDVASECIQKRVVKYDKTGDNHYDTISAFIYVNFHSSDLILKFCVLNLIHNEFINRYKFKSFLLQDIYNTQCRIHTGLITVVQ